MKIGMASLRGLAACLVMLSLASCGGSGSPDRDVLTETDSDATTLTDADNDTSPLRDIRDIDEAEADSTVPDPGATDTAVPETGTPDTDVPDSDSGQDTTTIDATGDTPSDSGGTDVTEPIKYPPDKPGKYAVGYYKEDVLLDTDRIRNVPFHVWYPALAPGAKTVNYLITNIGLLPGGAYENVPPARADGPFPLILFSHGFKGIAFQSFALVEYLASHGFVVVAPNHQGNTLLDFGFTKQQEKETVAKVTLLRPGDIAFAYRTAIKYNLKSGHVLQGMINQDIVAMTGHSFGGFTTLIVGGAEADMDRAKAACAAGVEADVMCPYLEFYEAGTMLRMDPAIPGLKAIVALAPGGYNAIFDDNLAKVTVPSLIMGGNEDDTCPVAIETRPIYDGLPTPKLLAVITGASHMSFTNVCTIPLVGSLMGDMCNMSITEDRAFQIINTLTTAYIRLHLLDETDMDTYLDPAYISTAFGEVVWTHEE